MIFPEKTITLEELRTICRSQFDEFDFCIHCENCDFQSFCHEFFNKPPAKMVLYEPKQKLSFEERPF